MRGLSLIVAGFIARKTEAVQIVDTGSDWELLYVNPHQKYTREKEGWQGSGKRKKPKIK